MVQRCGSVMIKLYNEVIYATVIVVVTFLSYESTCCDDFNRILFQDVDLLLYFPVVIDCDPCSWGCERVAFYLTGYLNSTSSDFTLPARSGMGAYIVATNNSMLRDLDRASELFG